MADRRWKKAYEGSRSTATLYLRVAPEAAERLRELAKAAGVPVARYVELLAASGGAPAQRLHGLAVVGQATAATNALADDLHALIGEVRKANGSVRSLFLDAPHEALRSQVALDAAALALRDTATRIDREIARLADGIEATLVRLTQAAREVRR